MNNASLRFSDPPLSRCNGSDGKAEDSGLKGPGFNPQLRQEKDFLLFSVGCFGAYARNICCTEMEKKVPSFLKMCASPCHYSGNIHRQMWMVHFSMKDH